MSVFRLGVRRCKILLECRTVCNELIPMSTMVESDIEARLEFVSKTMNVSPSNSNGAALLVSQYRRHVGGDKTRFEKLVQTLQSTNLTLKDVVYNTSVLTYSPSTIEQRYHRLVELGVQNIKVADIIGYNSIITKTSKELKESDRLQHDTEPLDCMMSKLDGPPNLKDIICLRYPSLEDSTVHYMHRVVVLEYLVWRLAVDREDVVAIIDKYLSIANRSLTFLVQTWDLLSTELGFSVNKIRSNGFLLMLHPDNVRQILTELPVLGGIPIQELVLKFPRILSIQLNHLREIDVCLRTNDITKEQVGKCGNVFTLRPTTLIERLKTVQQIPEFQKLKSSPRFLHLVYYQDKARRRLAQLQSQGFTNVTIDALSTSDQYFRNLVATAVDREMRSAVVAYLSLRLGTTKTKIQRKLQAVDLTSTSVSGICETVGYLVKRGFDEHQIVDVLPVVLHKVDDVKCTLDVLLTSSDENTKTEKGLLRLLKTLTAKSKGTKNQPAHKSQIKELKYGRYTSLDGHNVSKYLTEAFKIHEDEKS